jgi:hypothetical protein
MMLLSTRSASGGWKPTLSSCETMSSCETPSPLTPTPPISRSPR